MDHPEPDNATPIDWTPEERKRLSFQRYLRRDGLGPEDNTVALSLFDFWLRMTPAPPLWISDRGDTNPPPPTHLPPKP